MTLLRNARLRTGECVDVRVTDGQIHSITPAGQASPGADERIDAEGRWLLPGLWDEHVHFSQWAMHLRRIDLSAAASAAETAAMLRAHTDTSSDVLIGVNVRDANWPDRPSAGLLDEVTGALPTALISGDLHACWLNSAALAKYAVVEHDDGLIREAEAFRVEQALESVDQCTLDAWVGEAAAAAAARGVVGIVDFEMRDNLTDWQRRATAFELPLRVEAGIYPDRIEAAIAAGYATGQSLDASGLIRVGYFKVITDGSLNTRTAWCFEPYGGSTGTTNVDFDELEHLVAQAAAAGIVPAIHAIGDRANARVLDLYERVGCTGRIEHAQLLRWEDIERFARLGIIASIQPEHAMDDRDVADAYWSDRSDRAFVLHALDAAGVRLAFGSDAPVAPLDPWQAIAAAVFRSRGGRDPWHEEQRLPIDRALLASTRQRPEVAVGECADLILVAHDPRTADADQLRLMPVALTMLGGRVTHGLGAQ